MNQKTGIVDPNRPLVEQLGDDSVTLTKTDKDPDYAASSVINRIGTEHAPVGQKYCGSIVIHYYLDSDSLLKGSYSMSTVTMQTWKENISEALVATGINNAVIDIRTNFNPNYKFKTNRKNDKRGSVK